MARKLKPPAFVETPKPEPSVVPASLDAAEELAMAIHEYTADMLSLVADHFELESPGGVRELEHYQAGPKRLLAAIRRYESRIFDVEAGLLRVQKTKTKAPAAITPLKERINVTLEKCGYDVRTFWRQWNKDFGPDEPQAKRQAVHRATSKA
jgi:hypothetical protein